MKSNTPVVKSRDIRTHVIAQEIAKAHGFSPCDHPDCDGQSCATDRIYNKAIQAIKVALNHKGRPS